MQRNYLRAMLTNVNMRHLKIFVLLLGATHTCTGDDTPKAGLEPSSGEHYLFTDLFKSYNKDIRPVAHSNDITYVFLEIALLNLIKLDTRNQVLTTNSELIMKWYDHYLKWDPEKYENTTSIRVPYNKIWYPDVVLYNTGDSNYRNAIYNTNAIIKYTGEVELVSHAMLTSSCDIQILHYPFDEQNCKQHFASWTYDTTKIKLVQGLAEISEYEEHPEYFLEDYYSEITEQHDPCCELPFSTLTIHVRVQRRSMFAVYFYIIPGTIVNLCAIHYFLRLQRRATFAVFFFVMPGTIVSACGLMVFILPAEAGEKVSLATNSLLAMMVFLMAMTQDIPPTEQVPLIGKYYGVCIGILAFNIGVSVIVLRIHFSTADTVSPFVRVATTLMSRAMWIKIPEGIRNKWHVKVDAKTRKTFPGRKSANPSVKFIEVENVLLKEITRIPTASAFGEIKDNYKDRLLSAVEGIYRISIEQELRTLQQIERESSTSPKEWKFVAYVLDRFFCFVFIILVIIFNLYLLMSSPHEEEYVYCPMGRGKCPEDWDYYEYLPGTQALKDLLIEVAKEYRLDGDQTGASETSSSSSH